MDYEDKRKTGRMRGLQMGRIMEGRRVFYSDIMSDKEGKYTNVKRGAKNR
jgi:hypothetical protein